MGVFISFQTEKKIFLFGAEKLFWDGQLISLAMTVNTQLDLSKDKTFMGTILCCYLGRDCELPDATFALVHKMVLTSTRRNVDSGVQG